MAAAVVALEGSLQTYCDKAVSAMPVYCDLFLQICAMILLSN